MFDCSACTDSMKRANGCTDVPRKRDGTTFKWTFPPDSPVVEVDRCPARELFAAHDVTDMYRTLNLANGCVGVSDQNDLPPPYVEALAVAARQQAMRMAYDIKNPPGGKHAVKPGGRRGK